MLTRYTDPNIEDAKATFGTGGLLGAVAHRSATRFGSRLLLRRPLFWIQNVALAQTSAVFLRIFDGKHTLKPLCPFAVSLPRVQSFGLLPMPICTTVIPEKSVVELACRN